MTSAVADERTSEPAAKSGKGSRSGPVARILGFFRDTWVAFLVVFGLVAGFRAWAYLAHPVYTSGMSRPDVAAMQMKGIADAIALYRFEKRSLPTSLDELTYPSEMIRQPFMEKIPLDPWKQGYGYRIVDVRQGKFEISSDGEDKRAGTDDDLSYPERTTK